MTKIKAMSLYFKLYRSGKLNRVSGAFTSISFLTIIVQLLWPTPQNVCPMSSVKSDSTHHFFGNACNKSEPCVFPVFRLLNDFFCLLTYEFCLSIWKIARCSVILLLPLFTEHEKRPRHMTFEIQVLDWDRHENVAVLNRLIDNTCENYLESK